jgi:glucosamine kinase
MTYVMGIDGGGSTVRVAVTSPDLTICGQSKGSTANPNLIGRDAAAATIRGAMRVAASDAGVSLYEISAVGIGVAGAEAAHSEAWLRGVVGGVLPDVPVYPSSDSEIALVGAHGERRGLLVLAGTGSLALGINAAGKMVMVGGWGYAIGDEGSGYWIGREAMMAAIRHDDGRGPATSLTASLLERLNLTEVRAMLPWFYQEGVSRTKEVATFAGLVLEHAEQGDVVAKRIVEQAAFELVLAARAVMLRLEMEPLPVAFTGGLLSGPNALTRLLCELLGLDGVPTPRYAPVIGAAILALRVAKKEASE